MAADRDLHVTALTAGARAALGTDHPPIGRPLVEVLPWAGGQVEQAARAALTGGLAAGVQGTEWSPSVSVHPLLSSGGISGVLLSWVPQTSEPPGPRQSPVDAFAMLEAMTSALAGVRSTAEAVHVITGRCIPAMGVRSSCLALLDERTRSLYVQATSAGHPGYRTGESVPLDAARLLCQAARSGATLAADDHGGVVAAPLRVAGRVVGAVELEFGRGGQGRQLVGAATALWALALGRARTNEAEKAARASLREATTRLAFLAECTRTLNESIDLADTLEQLTQLSVPRLGDICAIHLLRAGNPRLTASAHAWPQLAGDARTWLRAAGGLASSPALQAVLDSGVPSVVRCDGPEVALRLATAGEPLEALRGLGLAVVAIVPLSVHGRVLGTMTLASRSQPGDGQPDVELVEEIGIRAATAIERAQLHEEQTRAISQLQASLLPPDLPDVAGLELATAFVPATSCGDVGGDFYDAFRMSDGRLLLVIGDVQGKGLGAAASTGLVRQSVRAAGVSATRPSDVVAHVNRVLLAAGAAAGEPHQLCTLSVLMVRPGDGAEVTLTCAGHPLPILLPTAGPVTRIGLSELLVGAFDDARWTDTRTHLSPGETLLCVTDGVTERRAGTAFFEDELDALVLASRDEPPARLVEVVRTEALAFSESRPADDMALLAMRVSGGTDGDCPPGSSG